jgi:hypothetical protein
MATDEGSCGMSDEEIDTDNAGRLAVLFNRAIKEVYGPDNGSAKVDYLDLMAACGSILGGYASDFPPDEQIKMVEKFDRLFRAQILRQNQTRTTQEIIRESERTMRVDMMKSARSPEDKKYLEDILTLFVPPFEGIINEYRVQGFPTRRLQDDSVILLGTMLLTLVRNTNSDVNNRPKTLRRLSRQMTEIVEENLS